MPTHTKQPKTRPQQVEASVFMNGKSQAVRIAAQFRFKGDHVYVRRDPATGDVVLSEEPSPSWRDFFAAHRGQQAPEDFLSERNQGSQADRFLM